MADTTSVVQPVVSGDWLTTAQQTAVAGQVENPIYPGAITSDHSGGSETVPGRTPVGGQGVNPIAPDDPDLVAYGDNGFPETDNEGLHNGPQAAHASQRRPFAGPGPIANTHSVDTGGVERSSQVIQPQAKGWFRRVLSGMGYDSQAYTYTPEGFKVNVATGRQDLDQYQGQDADAYDPRPINYSERPVYANFAAESAPLQTPPGAYVPSGNLSDMTPTGGQGNMAYAEPDDPQVNTSGAQAAGTPSDFQGGWL